MANTDRLEALQEDLANQVSALTSSDAWLAWLETASKFHKYSFNNTMLIMIQRPSATHVAGFRKWSNDFGRQVRKGEKSIGIFAPMIRKRTDSDGAEKTFVSGFRVVSVFDIEQTDGDPLPEQPLPVLLEGEAPAGLWDALETVALSQGYTVERGDCGTANGYTSPSTRTIRVRADVTDAQAVKTLAHECAHAILHTDGDALNVEHRGTAEVEAESVAYLVSRMHGLETSAYTLPYVAGWSGEDGDKMIRQTAERVLKTVRTITDLTLAQAGEPVAA